MKRHARKLSSCGFRVLVPDLYKGAVGFDKEEAAHLMNALEWSQATRELCDAAAFLQADGSAKVGVTGYCMGGALSLVGAASCSDILCSVPFYGVPGDAALDWGALRKPVQAHFGAEDSHVGFSDPKTAQVRAEKLAASGADCELFMYPGLGHAFMNDTPEPYKSWQERTAAMGVPPFSPEAADLAWERVVGFLKKNLA